PDYTVYSIRLFHNSYHHHSQLPSFPTRRSSDLEDLLIDHQIVVLRFLAQDGDAGFQIRRLDIRGQSPFKAAAQPLLQGGDILRRPVRGDHQLAVGFVEGVKSMEELFLGRFLAGDELDVVDEQDVRIAVFIAKINHGLFADG